MYRWRISILDARRAGQIGTLTAADQATAISKAMEVFGLSEALRFRVVAEPITKADAKAGSKRHPTRSRLSSQSDPRGDAMPRDFYWKEDLKFAVEVFDKAGNLIEVLARLHDLEFGESSLWRQPKEIPC